MISHTILCLDYGKKKMGLALKEKGEYFSHPIDPINHRGDVSHKILEICQRRAIQIFLIGLPLGKEGKDTLMSLEVKKFVHILENTLPKTIELRYFTERNSTVKAKLIYTQNPKKQRAWSQYKDSLAAKVILDEYLKDFYQDERQTNDSKPL